MKANGFYESGKLAIIDGKLDILRDDIRVVLVDGEFYRPCPVRHHFLSDIPKESRVATSRSLRGKSFIQGVFDADDIEIKPVPIGRWVSLVVIYKKTGNEKTSMLIGFISDGWGFPTTVREKSITIQWDNGYKKIFGLKPDEANNGKG